MPSAGQELCPIVAIGASAGGLDAFRRFFNAVDDPHPGVAFVLITHLDPGHPSMLAEHTDMTVVQGEDGMPVEANHIYTIPPGSDLTVSGGVLNVSPAAQAPGRRLPFDHFLRSLAQACGTHAICVVLSGTGGDGSDGLLDITDRGGLVIVQDPEEAEFDGMPRSAIATGSVHHVLKIQDIPEAIRRHLKTEAHDPVDMPLVDPATFPDGVFNEILELLRERTDHDFRTYKRSTLERRIARRIAMTERRDATRYLQSLHDRPAELTDLINDLLISVTGFFRDRQSFDFLSTEVLPTLVANRTSPLRVWVPACSTGEEAYSIAMLCMEAIERAGEPIKLRVIASDVNANAVHRARQGFYPESIRDSVGEARLKRFFRESNGGFQISVSLRDSVVFSVHDILRDPAFARIDLISCRNLMIYLLPEAQAKILSDFHFSLVEGGILFLGNAETVGTNAHFSPISTKHRIYRHQSRARPGEVSARVARDENWLGRMFGRDDLTPRSAPDATFLATSLLVDAFAPPSVLVDERLDCVRFFGRTEMFKRADEDGLQRNLLSVTHAYLRPLLRAALERSRSEQARATTSNVLIDEAGGERGVSIVVQPASIDDRQFLLISFLDTTRAAHTSGAGPETAAEAPGDAAGGQDFDNTLVSGLENAIRNRDTWMEKQVLLNEEATSFNEELQVTNEELMSSKEELQSLNEELSALNNQLNETIERERTTATDLRNILDSSGLATVFLDSDLHIRFFTPSIRALVPLIPSDIGRPLSDISAPFNDAEFFQDCQQVIGSAKVLRKEIETQPGTWHERSLLSYRNSSGELEGVIITFQDITEHWRLNQTLMAARQEAESANIGKSRFLGAASHDLRQPLQTLRLLQGQLAKAVTDETQQTLVTRIGSMIDSLTRILDSLLDINQLEAGIVLPSIEDFPLNRILDHIDDEFSERAKEKGLDWRLVRSRDYVRSDPLLLERMLQNLVSNALSYTPAGKVLVGCRRRGDSVCIEVLDTGVGVEEENLETIFGEFRQIGNDARQSDRGFGLGLSIVQRLGTLLGHRVGVRSRPDFGSTFSIEVPLGTERLALDFSDSAPDAPARPAGGLVLIVEDDRNIREALDTLFRDTGYRTYLAENGTKAVAIPDKPDLILADYNLPGAANGVEIALSLCERFSSRIPTVIISGDISTRALHDIARHDFVHRSKPVTPEDLLGTAARALDSDPEQAAAAGRSATSDTACRRNSRVYLVDDDVTLREALHGALTARGWSVQCFASAEDFLTGLSGNAPGSLIVDAFLPGMSGTELLEQLRTQGRKFPSILVTGSSDIQTAVSAIRAGADDFLSKPFSVDECEEALKRAIGLWADDGEDDTLRQTARDILSRLTGRQREVFDLVAQGVTNKEIAARMGIAQRTVESHRATVMKRTQSSAASDLVRLAIRAG